MITILIYFMKYRLLNPTKTEEEILGVLDIGEYDVLGTTGFYKDCHSSFELKIERCRMFDNLLIKDTPSSKLKARIQKLKKEKIIK